MKQLSILRSICAFRPSVALGVMLSLAAPRLPAAGAALSGASTAVPVIENARAVSINYGYPISYAIKATQSPTNYSASGLPPGLSVNDRTGVITGVTAMAGTFDVGLQATNAAGTGRATVRIMVDVGPPETPWATHVAVISPPTRQVGSDVSIAVTYQVPGGALRVTGAPQIPISIGGEKRHAVYTSGSGTNVLIFTYRLTGDDPAAAIQVGSSIEADGGTITDTMASPNWAGLGLPVKTRVGLASLSPVGPASALVE
jgi:hypothetical protein